MSLLLLIFAVAFVVSCLPLAFLFLRNRTRFRGRRAVVCPETVTPEAVAVNASHAAWTSIAEEVDFRVSSCSRWPARADCAQKCLEQVEAAPDGCLVDARVSRWYEGSVCALCGEPAGEKPWFDASPGLLGVDGRVRQWSEVASEDLPEAFARSVPVCYGCRVSETLRANLPDLSTEDSFHSEPRTRA